MIALHNCEDGSVGGELWDNEAMKTRDAERHPGPWRVMLIESGLIGIILAIGFLLMGFVSMLFGIRYAFFTPDGPPHWDA